MKSRPPYQTTALFLLLATFSWCPPALSTEGNDPFQMINEARATARSGKYPEALGKLEKALRQADESGQKLVMAIALSNMADIHRLQGDTLEALNHYYRALRIYEEIGNQSGSALTRRQIAMLAPQPKSRGEETGPATIDEPLADIPPTIREKLIQQAIERVRSRVKARQGGKRKEGVGLSRLPGEAPPSPRDTSPRGSKPQPAQDGTQLAYNAYLEKVREGIIRAWKYPEKASRDREEGRVDLEFTILKDGRLQNVLVSHSSGYASLDQEAVRAIKAASPFGPIPEKIGLKEIVIRFSFNYTLAGGRRPSKR